MVGVDTFGRPLLGRIRTATMTARASTDNRRLAKFENTSRGTAFSSMLIVPFGVTYEKIGTIQRRLAWPLHKDDTLFRVECTSVHNIYCSNFERFKIFLIPSILPAKNTLTSFRRSLRVVLSRSTLSKLLLSVRDVTRCFTVIYFTSIFSF